MQYSGFLKVNSQNETFISSQVHDSCQNRHAVVLECEVGKRAWLAVKLDDEFMPWHRINTSVVLAKKLEDGFLVINTENSEYIIELD